MKNHLETVSKIYDAFGKGDIPAILSKLADDVHWEEWKDNSAQNAGVPWLKHRKGKEGVMEFFKIIGGFKFHQFEVLSLMAGTNQVAAEILIHAEIPSTGGKIQDEEIHLWTFNDAGMVVRMRHYADTIKHVKAARLEMAV